MMRKTAFALPLVFMLPDAGAQNVIQNTYTIADGNPWPWYRGAMNDQGGFTMLTRPLVIDSLISFDIGLLRTDSGGIPIGAFLLETVGSDAPTHIMRSSGGHAWVAGMNRVLDPLLDMHGMLIKLDAQDQPLWARIYGLSDGSSLNIFDIVEMADGGTVMLGLIDPNPVDNVCALLLRLASDGAIVWSKRIMAPIGGLMPRSLAVMPDQSLVFAGMVSDTVSGVTSVLAGIDPGGTMAWSYRYFGDSTNSANRVVVDPGNGLVVLGNMESDSMQHGYIMRTDPVGQPTSALMFGTDVLDAYPFPDGSLMTFARSGGGSSMVRADADGIPMWSTDLEVNIGEGRLLPYDEASRFAYFSGDWFETLALNTFTSQCYSCGAPGDTTLIGLPYEFTPSPAGLVASAQPLLDSSIAVVAVPYIITHDANCSMLVPSVVQERQRPTAVHCSYDRVDRTLSVAIPEERDVILLCDLMGREQSWSVGSVEPGSRTILDLPALQPGIHALITRSGTCAFFVDN